MFWLKPNAQIKSLHMDNLSAYLCKYVTVTIPRLSGYMQFIEVKGFIRFLGHVFFLYTVIISFKIFCGLSLMFHCTGSHMTLKEEKKMFERKGQKLFVNYLSPGDIQRWYYLFFFIVTVQYTVSLRVQRRKTLTLREQLLLHCRLLYPSQVV